MKILVHLLEILIKLFKKNQLFLDDNFFAIGIQ